jgi:hypothetical protein
MAAFHICDSIPTQTFPSLERVVRQCAYMLVRIHPLRPHFHSSIDYACPSKTSQHHFQEEDEVTQVPVRILISVLNTQNLVFGHDDP